VVLYDRAGLGWSDPGPWPTTGKRIVADLHALLDATRIPPPYVLVGHSVAGFHVRLYAARHPERVAGLVLVDSSHPDQLHRLRERCGGWRFSQPGRWL
jgi:pimeloyl-ACP methyl ester carboxylesterase